ncbi:hypothetical protein O181_023910 [Austropuccinia psidii MF-1]|uniref:Uncharacterized protein n=1 Tax=Austropuccinia psidii MF-1 TaxID=1389203 RepID=A0A9Q3GZJ6_9BASI|nr:hypothetical protein [Austropuccinia psidii MF-1]
MPLPAKCNLVTLPTNAETTHAREFISAVGALHAARPGADHWKCLQHLLGYVHHTRSLSLCLEPRQGEPQLDVFLDASWGGEFSRSTHGFLAQVNGCSIAWCSKRLVTVAASSCHAEFMALGIAARHDSSSNKQTKHSDREFFITNQILRDGTATLALGSVSHQHLMRLVLFGTERGRT